MYDQENKFTAEIEGAYIHLSRIHVCPDIAAPNYVVTIGGFGYEVCSRAEFFIPSCKIDT